MIELDVIRALESELDFQERKWPDHKHSVGEFILIMEKCLHDCKRKWTTCVGDDAALHEIRQVCAVGIAAMNQHWAPMRGVPVQNGNGQQDLPEHPLNRTETASAAL